MGISLAISITSVIKLSCQQPFKDLKNRIVLLFVFWGHSFQSCNLALILLLIYPYVAVIVTNVELLNVGQSLALAHCDVNIEDGKVVFVPWVETDFRTGEDPWWA